MPARSATTETPAKSSSAPPKSRRRVTIYTIAREAGISPSAVSLALRHSAEVSAKTRARVKAIAAGPGYEPKLMARRPIPCR